MPLKIASQKGCAKSQQYIRLWETKVESDSSQCYEWVSQLWLRYFKNISVPDTQLCKIDFPYLSYKLSGLSTLAKNYEQSAAQVYL
jgi:hypothetical protein